MKICRRLFVVPLADNDYGKSTIIRSLVSQAQARRIEKHKKAARRLTTPWGREIDAYIFGRSYQEVEQGEHGSVLEALDANDPLWRTRELIVMPSHVDRADIKDISQMIDLAHVSGFDAVAAPVVYWSDEGDNRAELAPALALHWDMRWTIPNPHQDDPSGQLWSLGSDLWTWIARAMVQ